MPELTCFRLLDAESPAGPLAEVIRQVNSGHCGKEVFALDAVSFGQVPNAPFAYWVEEKARKLFKELPAFESESRTARQGLATADNFRFVRCWWEIPIERSDATDRRWWPLAKGGAYSPYYADLHLCVNWAHCGAEVKQNIIQKYPYLNGNAGFVAKNTEYYFRPGLTWTHRTTADLAFRVLPRGVVFDQKGPAVFMDGDEEQLLATLAFMNSRPFIYLVNMLVGAADSAAKSYDNGIISLMPTIPSEQLAKHDSFCRSARQCWNLKYEADKVNELSHAFISPWQRNRLPMLVQFEAELRDSSQLLASSVAKHRQSVDQAVEELLGFKVHESRTSFPSLEIGDGEDEEGDRKLNSPHLLLSYLVGVSFGRWAIPAICSESHEQHLSPFSPLPVKAPGAAPADHAKLYFVVHSEVESELLSSCREALRLSTGLGFVDAYEQDLAARIGANNLRDYFAKPSGFFADHLSVYSKSRRKSPIYWPLSTRSGNFVIWVYYPKLDVDSLPRLITEVLDPRLRYISEELAGLARDGKAGARKAQLELLRLELSEMRHDFQGLIAKGFKPNLNDGVLITACPLAKYFRLPKFRKDLEDCWKKLSKGEYDWSHLAMSMWPDRVLAACRCDRSIAIAHGKEELCPVEPAKVTRGRKKKTD